MRCSRTGARQGLSVCLHEHRGGFAFNQESIHGLAKKALRAGAEIDEGIEVKGFEMDGSGAVTRVHTSEGDVHVEQVIVAVGPWIAKVWGLLGLPRRLEVAGEDREMDLLVPPGGRDRRGPAESS